MADEGGNGNTDTQEMGVYDPPNVTAASNVQTSFITRLLMFSLVTLSDFHTLVENSEDGFDG